jgi:predicted MPP superfamily phosphohydrolase
MLKVYYAIVIFVLAVPLLFIYARWLEPNWLQVHSIDIEIQGLDPRLEGFTILHLTDLHQVRHGPNQTRIKRAVEGREYDMVALTGDVLDHPNRYDYGPTAELLAILEAPVYFVFGNHDYPGSKALGKALQRSGVHVLANSWESVTYNEAVFQIAGIHDPHWTKYNPGSRFKTDLSAALQGTDPKLFTLLLSHSPGIIDSAATAGIALILTGHTHGGQIKIPLVGAPTTASGKLFDKYVQGLYRKGETQLYINRGLGTTSMPLRFLSRPEILFIRLVRGD